MKILKPLWKVLRCYWDWKVAEYQFVQITMGAQTHRNIQAGVTALQKANAACQKYVRASKEFLNKVED